MGTTISLASIGGFFAFLYGLVLGIVAHESGLTGNESLGVVLLLVVPNTLVVGLIVIAGWRNVSAPALVDAFLGAVVGAAFVLGFFSTVAITDLTLAEFGGHDTWQDKLRFGLVFAMQVLGILGLVNAIAVSPFADALSWLADHAPRIRGRRHVNT